MNMEIVSFSKNKHEVRAAGPADEQEVYRLLLLGHAENAICPADNAKVIYFVRRFLFAKYIPAEDMGPRGVIGVIGPVGALEAIYMLGIGCFWYSSKMHLEDYILYVDPNFRNGAQGAGHARALLEWGKHQSDKTGLPLLTGILSNHRTDAKCRLYRRAMTKVGEYFIHGDFYCDELLAEVTGSSKAA